MWARLAKDRRLWLFAAVLAASAAPYFLPGLTPEQRADYGFYYATAPAILANLVLFQVGLRRRPDAGERRFWNLWTAAFVCWIGQQVVINVATWGSLPAWLGEEAFYAGFYLCLLVSLIRPPGTRPPDASTLRARLEVAAASVFTVGALAYFVLVPLLVERDVFLTFIPSLVLYLFLDGVLLLALREAHRRAVDARWRSVYAWLLASGVLFFLLGALELLMTAEILPWVGTGTPLDIVWLAPHLTLAVAARVREQHFEASAAAEPPPLEETIEEPGLLGSLWSDPLSAYVAVFPVLHFGLQGAGALDPEHQPLRDLLVLGLVLVLAAFAIVHDKLLLRDSREQARLNAARAKRGISDDTLTGLPNRYLFSDRLHVAVPRAFRRRSRLAVLFIDLDRFKVVNDTLGHGAGDALLLETSRRLRTALRQADTLARFGGDEFVALIEDVREPTDAARVADKLHGALRPPFEVEGRELFVTASIGISLYPDDSSGADEAIRNADIAMYRAKERGRNCTRLYTSSMSEEALEQLRLENELRWALARGELALQYQPILDVGRRSVTGYEALLRWRHPARGLLLPGEFIELSELTGMIAEIGPWVLRTACREAASWQAGSGEAPGVSVNVSPRQLLGADLVEQVSKALQESELPPQRLTLEITESLALQNPQRSSATLGELHRLGVRLAIDDFGTGHSSLSQLKRFPVDTLKVDRGFVSDLHQNAGDRAIIATVITMARTLGMRVVAEGVELEEQLDVLRADGCHMAQGFLLGRPEWPERLSCAPAPAH